MNNIGEQEINAEKFEDEIKYLHGVVNMSESDLDFLRKELFKTKESSSRRAAAHKKHSTIILITFTRIGRRSKERICKQPQQTEETAMNQVHFMSKSNEWETPIDLFEKLNDEFNFTLDPCSTDNNHKCDKYYTQEVDGLKQSWKGERVFCNPPYGRAIKDWVKKSYEESIGGHW